jgi:MoaA/NifB/PqqE/SkfB family radical SAM enzyme
MLHYKNRGRLLPVYGRSILVYSTPKKLMNALRTELAYRRRIADVQSMPYLINVEPLYYCNLECPLCDRQIFPFARQGKEAGKLSLELWDRILDEVGDYLFQCHIFGQGEPLLDWTRTKEIISRTHQRRIFTLLSTNCTLVTPEIAAEMPATGLDYLVCAIDGVSQKSYSRYRVGGNVDKALSGMRLFMQERDRQKSSMQIEWQFLVHKHNIHEMDKAREIAEEMGVYLRFATLHGMEFNPALQDEWLPESSKWSAGQVALGETPYNFPCYFLWRALVLNSNGRMARCLIYQNVAEYGDANTHTVQQLYNSPSMQRARELFRKGSVSEGDFPPPCRNCSFYKREHGGENQTKHESLDLGDKVNR